MFSPLINELRCTDQHLEITLRLKPTSPFIKTGILNCIVFISCDFLIIYYILYRTIGVRDSEGEKRWLVTPVDLFLLHEVLAQGCHWQIV